MADDPHWNDVSLLLSCNGANGSTAFADSSKTPKTVTPSGNAQISTAQSKWGGSSALLDGAGDALSLSSALISSQDYTIESWIYPLSYSASASWGRYIYSQYDNAIDFGNRMLFGLKENGSKKLYAFRAGDGALEGATDLPLKTWTHVALVRSGAIRYLFVNGALDATGSASGSISSAPSKIGACRYTSSDTGFFHGHIDEMRITVGVARYTAAFSVPTAPFDAFAPLVRAEFRARHSAPITAEFRARHSSPATAEQRSAYCAPIAAEFRARHGATVPAIGEFLARYSSFPALRAEQRARCSAPITAEQRAGYASVSAVRAEQGARYGSAPACRAEQRAGYGSVSAVRAEHRAGYGDAPTGLRAEHRSRYGAPDLSMTVAAGVVEVRLT